MTFTPCEKTFDKDSDNEMFFLEGRKKGLWDDTRSTFRRLCGSDQIISGSSRWGGRVDLSQDDTWSQLEDEG